MSAFIYLILSIASGTMAILTWHSNMPKVITMRGRWHGICEWMLGIGLALLSPALLTNALNNVVINWQFIAADISFITYSFCRYRWLRSQSDGSWSHSV